MFRWGLAIILSLGFSIGIFASETETTDVKISPQSIIDFIDEIEEKLWPNEELHAFLLMQNGKIIAEGYWKPYEQEEVRALFSLSKAFAGTAIGFAVQEKLLNVEDKVIKFFPDELPNPLPQYVADMTIDDLLTMQSGHDKCATKEMFEDQRSPAHGFFSKEIVHKPGTFFVYNNGATYMLSQIITKVSGVSMLEYLTPRLFQPLDIRNPEWEEDKDGVNYGAWGLMLPTRELAKFGQFYLQNGKWNNQQLLSPEWIKTATSRHSTAAPENEIDWVQGYGYQFWLCQHNAFRADGALGQYIVVMPNENAVLIMNGNLRNTQIPLTAAWNHLLPALRGEVTVNPADQEALDKRLASLELPLPSESTGGFPCELTASFPDNEFIKTMNVVVKKEGVSLKLNQDKQLFFPFNSWLSNEVEPDEKKLFRNSFKARSIITAPNQLTLIGRFFNYPGHFEMKLKLSGTELSCDVEWFRNPPFSIKGEIESGFCK